MLRVPKLALILAALIALGFTGWTGYRRFINEFDQQCEAVWAHGDKCRSFATSHNRYAKASIITSGNRREREEQFSKLRDGLTQEDVITLVGRPNFADADVSNLGSDYFGCEWSYVSHPEDSNSKERVLVRFDSHDMVKELQLIDRAGSPTR